MNPSNKYIFASLITMAANDETLRQAFRQQLIHLRESQENRDKLSTPEAISRIVNGKASQVNIKKSIFLANKSEATQQQTRWFDPKREDEMISICNEACDLTKQQRQQSMRSTEKNLSEMNNQILKMRKSLTDKGILDQGSKNQDQLEEGKMVSSNISEAKKREEEILEEQKQVEKVTKNNALKYKTEEKQSQEEDVSNVHNNDQDQHQIQSTEIPIKQLQDQRQTEDPQDEKKIEKSQTSNIEQNPSNLYENQSTHSQIREQYQPPSKVYMNNKSFARQQKHIDPIEEREGEQSTILDPQSRLITHQNSDSRHFNHAQMGKSTVNDKIQQSSKKDEKDQMQGENRKKEDTESKNVDSFVSRQLNNNSNNGYQSTQRDNEFFDEVHSPKHNAEIQRSRIFRPKLSQNQRLISLYPTNFFSHCSTQHQKIYAKIKFKLSKLFEHYIKEIKPTALTFDTIPKSLDLTTTLKYYKEFQFNKLSKPGQISKIFKKFAVNGLWLEETGFHKMHEIIFEIPKTINQDLQFCQILHDKMARIERQRKQKEAKDEQKRIYKQEKKRRREEGNQELESEEEEKEKKQVIEKVSEEDEKRMDKIFHTLSRINDSYVPDEKVSKKLNIRFMSPKTIKHEFDPQKLRNIIKSHTGTSKQLLNKMNEQKKQQEIRHQMQVQRILEKYKNQKFPQHHSQTKSTKSLRINHHKVDSYAQRNRIKKGGSAISTVKTIQDSHASFKSGAKLRPYFMERNNHQQSQILTQVSQAPSNKKKTRLPIQNRIEVYRQLSLPKLPKRKMRDESIYQSLMKIDIKPELEIIKSLVNNEEGKEQDEFFNDFYIKERKKALQEKQQRKKSPIQQRMKFT